MKIELSEMLASCTPIHDRSTKDPSRKCTFNHFLIANDFNNWRDVPDEDRITHSCLGQLPDVTPLATNGILFLHIKGDGTYFFGLVSNLEKPEKVQLAAKPKKPKAESEAKPKQRVISVNLDDLFA